MIRFLFRTLILLLSSLSLAAFITAAILRQRTRSIGETFIFHTERDDPNLTFTYLQTWATTGGSRIAIGRFHYGPRIEPPRPFFESGHFTTNLPGGPIERNTDPSDRITGNDQFQFFRRDYHAGQYSDYQRSLCAPGGPGSPPPPLLPTLTLAHLARSLQTSLTTRRRLRTGACPRCGYDLRHTPNQCPECGEIPQRLS